MLPTYLQVTPLTLVLLFFFFVPVMLVIIVSFLKYQMLVGIVAQPTLKNYIGPVEQSRRPGRFMPRPSSSR